MARRTVLLPVMVAAAALAACLAAALAVSEEARAAFPGENGGVVFSMFRAWDDPFSLYSADANTGALTRLTDNDGTSLADYTPAVSPDGTRVVFAKYNGISRYIGLYVVNTDGSGLEKIADDPALTEFGPAWSPDGRKIAFSAYPNDQNGVRAGATEVYVADADGTDRKKITDSALAESDLAWSPDGTEIAFGSYGDQDGDGVGDRNVYMMGADGSGARRIADGAQPSWSPDGEKLAYACGAFRERSICTVNPDGSDQQRIVTDRFEDDPYVEYVQDSDPAWSPDGTKIAFAREIDFGDTAGNSVYTMNPDGSELRGVFGYFPRAIDPDWGPAPGTRPPPDGPPETTIFSGPSGLVGRSASLDFVASRPGASFECSLDGAEFSPCDGPRGYGALSGGEHTFAVRATDAAGADPTPAARSFTVDATAPRGFVAIDGGRGRTLDRSVTLTLRAYDPAPGSGVSQVRLRNGGEASWRAWRPYAGRATTWPLSFGEGTKTVFAQYRDGAGNVSTVATDSIVYRR